jgi:serine phosphatase RsbU (regulator of sigma subunit)
VEPVSLQADPPFGTVPEYNYRVQRLVLEPGDRLIFFTDGIVERNTTDIDIATMLAASAKMHPREAVQHIIQAILHATSGALDDDATALCLDWHGGPVRERTTDSGSNL